MFPSKLLNNHAHTLYVIYFVVCYIICVSKTISDSRKYDYSSKTHAPARLYEKDKNVLVPQRKQWLIKNNFASALDVATRELI